MRCELCATDGGRVLWSDSLCRVVRADVEGYSGLCRVIFQRHVGEMTDLDPVEREQMMRVVYACERTLRDLFRPDKINLASLGNQVPHLHWHVIARYRDDLHFPDPIWAAPRRAAASARAQVADAQIGERLRALLGEGGALRA